MAANFFRFDPSDRFLDVSEVSRYVDTMYEAAEGDPKFGDLLLLFREGSLEPIHAAVYIAGDIVYTKSGEGIFSPFVLMEMSDFLSVDARDDPKVSLSRFRPKSTD
jgi:hypothetical protein